MRYQFLITCFIGVLFSCKSFATLITHEVRIQPYQVCFDAFDCADMSPVNSGYIESFSDQLYSKAGLDVSLLSFQMNYINALLSRHLSLPAGNSEQLAWAGLGLRVC